MTGKGYIMDWNGKPYHSLDWEMKGQFGKKLYKISLNGNMSCPNRDGTIGYGGCIFCSPGGSGDFAAEAGLSVKDQLAASKARIGKKLPKGKPYGYIAYFQAFTSTYAPVDKLERLYREAVSDEEVEVLSIATRPDCLSEEVLSLLEQINREKPVWVELGLQTIHEKTALWMRRGYELSCFDEAVEKLKAIGISVIVHIILGLPGEGKKELLETVDYLNGLEISGVKLQLLHILEGTDLASLYREGKVQALSYEEYEALLFAAVGRLKPEITIHRITGDGAKKILIAPLWSGNKRMVLNTIHRNMKKQNVYQGKDYENRRKKMEKSPRELFNEKRGKAVVKNLESRHFEAYYCATREEALKKALDLIPETSLVSWGGSVTVREIGLTKALNDGNYRTIDRDKATSEEEKRKAYMDALGADYYLSSANGISEDGQLVNVDGNGNRVAAIVYGPRYVIIVAGMNKVVRTADEALSRARTVAAPLNQQRFLKNTPCTVTGVCGDCKSPDCICNQILTTRSCRPAGRIKVILVGEDLGY